MGLSTELINRFVKITKDMPSKKDSIVYGTVKKDGDKIFVQIDGSDILTPMPSVTTAKDGDRVKVEIKDHMAVIAGNMTSPSAMYADLLNTDNKVEAVVAEVGAFEILIADKASVGELEAHKAYVTELLAGKITVDQLEAELAVIDALIAKKVSTDIFEAKTAEIDALLADKATIEQLGAAEAAIGQLNANKANISDLDAINAEIKNLDTEKADIDELNAAKADIKNLTSDVADIDTLIFGSASGNSIQTSFANAVIAMLGNAQIKSAMIEALSASKITSGDIITNNVRVLSEDGSLIISDETMQIKDSNRVRVQIGKDGIGDYSINIWDANGKLMFSQGGITEDAIKESIIRNDMVAANANISASKLDIDSLFEEINGSTKTIKATKVYFDDKKQTLDLAFTQMSSEMDDMGGRVESQGTQLSIIQGQIDSKIWQSDIDGAIEDIEGTVTTLSNRYSQFNQTLDEISGTVASHTTQLLNKADGSEVQAVNSRVSELSQSIDGFRTTVSNTYATKDSVDNVKSQLTWQKSLWLDASSYDENLWIPFVANTTIPTVGYGRIRVSVALDSLTVPSWSTHGSGFSVEFEVETKRSGWNAATRDEIIHKDTYKYCEVSPVSYKQLTYGSLAVLYLRGGGRYYVSTSWDTSWTANPDGYTWVSGSYTQSAPASDTRPEPDGYAYGTKTEIKQLSDRIISTVSDVDDLGVRVSTVEQTANGFTARIESAETNAANAKTTADNVAADLANNYTEKTLPDTRDANQIPSWYITNYPRQIITEFKYTSTIGLSGETFCTLTTTVPWANNSGGYPKQLAKVGAKEYWRVGTSGTTWSAWTDSYGAAVDAAKTATNFLDFSSAGLVIGDMTASKLGQNILIDSNSIDFRNGTTTLASYQADAIYLAMQNPNAVIDMCGGMARFKNVNDDPSNDWHRLGIEARDQISMDTHALLIDALYDPGTGEYGEAMLSMQSFLPWSSDYNIQSYASLGAQRQQIDGEYSNNQIIANGNASHAKMRSMIRYANGNTFGIEAAVNADSETFMVTADDGYEQNAVELMRLRPGICRIGKAMYDNNEGEMLLCSGDAIWFYLKSADKEWKPYYSYDDGLKVEYFYTAGFTASARDVYFIVPLPNPVVGAVTPVVESGKGLILRQSGYKYGSGSSTYVEPTSYEAWLVGSGSTKGRCDFATAVAIKATFSSSASSGVTANAPIGVQWDGYIDFI